MTKSKPKKDKDGPQPSPYSVLVSNRFIVLSWLSCMLVAFAVGRMSRLFLVINPQKRIIESSRARKAASNHDDQNLMKLPNPVIGEGKEIPQTSYTSKNFDTARSATVSSRWVVTDEGRKQCVDSPGSECENQNASTSSALPATDEEDDEEEEHLPQGQHLLIDIENVDPAFLNSEERLAQAMLDLVYECGLTLLSYHCHGLQPTGVSCAGVLLESHVSFHTWPTEGVITLDLFTCGPNSLLPIAPLAQRLFSVPDVSKNISSITEHPRAIWAHKYRGFGEDSLPEEIAELIDFYSFPIGVMTDFKKEVISQETDFQRIDIYDALRPQFQSIDAYRRSLLDDGSYESLHPEFFEPDRIVFLDGVLQSRRSGDASYHEALVHPAMFAHENPKRVAIIGGGEGATLREVLKHKTVEKVIMIEIDQKMVELSREYLPFWSDCSMLSGSTPSCFEDSRVEVYYEDAFKWFIDRYLTGKGGYEPFDAIIMDALDPQVQKSFVDALYAGGPFLQSLPNALAPDGFLLAQVGEASGIDSPSEEHSLDRNRVKFIQSLVDLGFESVRDYEEGNSGFGHPWQFIVAFKSSKSKAGWFADESQLNLKIRQRALSTVDGKSPFLYFDGTTMSTYKYPSKASEVVFCRRDIMPQACIEGHGFDTARQNLPPSVLEVKQSSVGETTERGLFAKVEIPEQSYVALDKIIPIVQMSPSTVNINHGVENVYNPAKERQVNFYSGAIPRRDIAKGEEMLDNYVGMTVKHVGGWLEHLKSIKKQYKESVVGDSTGSKV